MLLSALILLMTAAACSGESNSEKTLDGVDFETFLKVAEIPENLSLEIDANRITESSNAKKYKAVMLELEPETVIQGLLREKIVASEKQATGLWYRAGNGSIEEYLIVFDGGKSFGEQVDVHGGLSYTLKMSGQPSKYPVIISRTAGPPDFSEQRLRSKLRSDYASESDLAFMRYEDALSFVKKRLEDIGIPPLNLVATHSLDLDTMLEHYRYYLEEKKEQSEILEIRFSQEDEAYQFYFRQQIDNIPVIHVPWEWGKGSATGPEGNVMKFSNVEVTFTREGITDIRAKNLFHIEESDENKEQPLISVVAAMQLLFDDYSDLLLDKGTKVNSAELCYVSIPNGENYELIPSWVFGIAKPLQLKELSFTFEEYNYYVVNAITGERMSGWR